MYMGRIIVGFFGLLMVAAFIDSFLVMKGAVDMQRDVIRQYELDRLRELTRHCTIVWGDTEHFDACMRGETIVPHSGMID